MLSRGPKQGRQPREQRRQGFPWLQALLVIGWANGVVPSLLQIAQAGRPPLDVSVIATMTPVASGALKALTALFALVALFAAIRRKGGKPATGLGTLTLFLAPWAAIHLSALANGQPLGRDAAMLPLAAVAVWRLSPPLRDLKILGTLTVVTALVSLALGQLAPTLGNIPAPATGDKSTLDGLLAGVYSHPNTLGMALALGFPGIFLFSRRRWKVIGGAAIIAAGTLAASRTSTFAIGAELLVAMLLRVARPHRRLVLWAALMVMVGVLVRLPLAVSSPSEFSSRGQIWLASRDVWAQHPWLGAGPAFYRQVAMYVNDFGHLAFHGHNFFLHILTVSGLLGVAALFVMLFGVAKSVSRYAVAGQLMPAVYLVGFIGVGWLEVVNDFRGLSTLGFAVWLPLSVIMFKPAAAENGETDRSAETATGESAELQPVPAARSRLREESDPATAATRPHRTGAARQR